MPRAFHPLDLRGALMRLVVALTAGAIAWGVAFAYLSPIGRLLAAWDVAAIVLLILAAVIIGRSDSTETRRRAASEDPGRIANWFVVIGGSVASVLGAITVVRDGTQPLLAAITVALSWLLTHAEFTLRYAHLYYRAGRDDEGGLEFPGHGKPDDFDFAYFSFTIGMCFQTSDVDITGKPLRRATLFHALMSFGYNTVIVALVLNLVVSKISG